MDVTKMKKPSEGDPSYTNAPIHIMALNFRRSLTSNPGPVSRRYFSHNPLFRLPFLGVLTPHSLPPNRLLQPPSIRTPHFYSHHESPSPLFRFMDLVNNKINYRNRVRFLSMPDSDSENSSVSNSGDELGSVDIRRGGNLCERLLSVSHEISGTIWILEATGMIASAKFVKGTGLISFEGRFEIKKLYGLVDRETGLISLWLEFAMSDSSVVSGVVAGPLIAASFINVIYVPLIQRDEESEDGEGEDDESEDVESGDGESEDGESGNDGSEDDESGDCESGDDGSEDDER